MNGHCCFFCAFVVERQGSGHKGIFGVNFSEKRAGGINKRFIVRNVLR